MLAIFWDPDHKVLTYVYSGSADRFRSACRGRPGSCAWEHVSLWHNLERGCMAQRLWWVVARRRESDQAKGRHPYLPTGASVLWSSLHAHKSQDKGA